MFPTLAAGLLLLAVCLKYALEPHRRHVPLMLALGVLTLVSGALGFVTGLITTVRAVAALPPEQHFLWSLQARAEPLRSRHREWLNGIGLRGGSAWS